MSRKHSLKIFLDFLLNLSSQNSRVANNLAISISALLVGTLFSIYLIGKNILPTETEWLFYGDAATYQIGWLYFRSDSWHWPLTFTENLGYPTGVSISYTDSVPIFAILFKLISNLIPHDFQYFGILLLLNLTLQFFWGSQIGLLLSKGNLTFSLASGALFLLTPPFIWRFSGNFALTSHWLILAALWSYFKLRSPGALGIGRVFLIQSVIIILSSGINPYIALLSSAFIVVSHLELIGLKRATFKVAIAKIISLILLLVSGWYLFGYLSGNSSVGNSYGIFSLNLASIFNPMGFSSFLQSFSSGTWGQYEGYSYLGLGTLLLLFTNLLALAFRSKHKIQLISFAKLVKDYQFLLLLLVFLTTISLSNKIYWQDVLAFEYPLSPSIESWLASFRCSGRLFWPVYYLILIATLISTLRFWTLRQTKLLLALIISIQFLDTLPLQSFVTHTTHTAHTAHTSGLLYSQKWNQLSQKHNKLIILPSFQCGASPAAFPVFEKLAALQGLKTNSVYLARYTSSQIQVSCEQLPQEVSSGRMEKNAAYVLDRKQYFDLYTKINANKKSSHYCSDIDGFILCASRNSSIEGKTISLNPPMYILGKVIDFSDAKTVQEYGFGQWSATEAGGTWTNGKEANLWMGVKGPVEDDLLMSVEAVPLLHKKHPHQVVDVLVNGQFLTQWVFHIGSHQDTKLTVHIPKKLVDHQFPWKLTFHIMEPVSPKALGLSDDGRELGLFFQKLQLSDVKPLSNAN